jgi:hypothetical protein
MLRHDLAENHLFREILRADRDRALIAAPEDAYDPQAGD